MIFTNQEISESATKILVAFSNEIKYIPIKLNFAIQKNLYTLLTFKEKIEKKQMEIASKYGELNSEGTQFVIKSENKEKAEQELKDLFAMKQDIDIRTCSLSQVKDINLTMEQMQAIMFMITED